MKVKNKTSFKKVCWSLPCPLYAVLSQNMSTVFILSNHLKPAWC